VPGAKPGPSIGGISDGLTYPVGDEVVNGTYKGNFGGAKNSLVISGQFHGLFP